MQPFDERIHEEDKQENEALIAFLHQTYRCPADMAADEREQVLARVRERLLRYDETETAGVPISPLYLVERKISDAGSDKRGPRFPPGRSGKSSVWGGRMRMMMAVAVVILLVGSTAVLLQLARQRKSGLGDGTNWPVLAQFEGTGSQTFSELNLVVPKGRGVGANLSCDGPGGGSVTLFNKYPLLSDSGEDDWDHPLILNLSSNSCSLPTSARAGGGPYILHEVRVTANAVASWKVKIVSFPSPMPDLHLPTLSLPKSQVSLGEFAGNGEKILFPSAYALPINFHPDQPWQLYLVCRGPGKVFVDLGLGETYQLSSEYKYHLPSQVIYPVPCSTSAPVSVSQLFPPSLNAASDTVTVDVVADPDVNWDWILGWCTNSGSLGCQPSHEKP